MRIDEGLVARAEAEGGSVGRSTSAQVTHWARLGRAVEATGVATSAIRAVLEQRARLDDLSEEDQAAVTAAWAAHMEDRLAALDMEAEHERHGTPYAELDDDGNVIVIHPTSSPSTEPDGGS